ncbi:transducin family protein / WD-40 repeat family protein [Prunus dulcis]|uniref:Transducin family protein / WD-40 repeat family protein n=1 Tax=Prunus dulcis TaxID=3755 RepID=A0A4Y1RPM8_PRUDU|nr:transducin family protein / WD-40 repeat family protein [Prunus dulcis]
MSSHNMSHGNLTSADLDLRVAVHYGIPSTASILAFDPIQRLLAIGTLDGRIKVIGGDGIEGLLISRSNCLTNTLRYVGDDYALVAVMKYDAEEGKLLQLPVLIAYQNGLVILWDVSEDQIVFVGGGKDLQLKDGVVKSTNEVNIDSPEETLEHQLGDKEISALCWASSNGSILAVGYIDGDILFWNTSSSASIKGQQALSPSNNVVKLRLSSAERRLPVIVLQWSKDYKSHNDCDGQLFIYGGDEIGSEEVLTVLTLEWSPGMGNLRCVGRTDLTLTGSFADMILLPSSGTTGGNHKADVFVLTNPGQLHFYDEASLSALVSQKERNLSISGLEFPVVIPTTNPTMTVAKLIRVPTGENLLKALSEISSVVNRGSIPNPSAGTKWPLTGGVPGQLSISKNNGIERVYLAGYSDGSVRIWNATYPLLSFICLVQGEVQGIKVAGSSAPVSRLDFCVFTLNLAVGNECGLVQIYNLKDSSDGTKFLFVTETKSEVHNLPQGKGPQCRAVLSLINSPVQALQFVKHGGKLAVGFECGHVAVLDTSSLTVLFFLNDVSFSSSPTISMTWKELTNSQGLLKSPKHSETKTTVYPTEEVMFILTKDAHIHVIDGNTDGRISASKVSDDNPPEEASKDSSTKNEPVPGSSPFVINSPETEQNCSSENPYSEERLLNSFILLCCVDSLRLYSTKSVIQTGEIEIRSLPDLELVKESTLMSILRWNCKANMDKTMSADDSHFTLANGYESAFVSMLAVENGFRIPESLPCLHDKVVAAAADAALSVSLNQKKKRGTAPGLLGIVKGLKGGKMVHTGDSAATPKSTFDHLEGMFWKSQQSGPSPHVDHQEVVELNIDDIEIDEPLSVASTSSSHDVKREGESEREKLFQGGTGDTKPRLRTAEEIRAKYRKAEDASSVASQAKNKLMERGEKLERISRRTEDLQNGAEDFASLANELVKTLEGRKWWHI